ncbi:MAG TPA: LPXTG cell wall anchor domain-containing protein [Candidatus Limnocylindrales bacterium]
MAGALGLTAGAATAHVNRTVGPYALLVVLVEEPVYADNHAGFEFWARKDSVPVLGLDKTVKAVASGHGVDVDLAIPPIDGTGFYVLDHSKGGAAFDPMGGGAWNLVLTGTIDGTALDTTFPVTFPSYPRIGTAGQQPATVGTSAAPNTGASSAGALIAAAAAALIVCGLAAALRVRRRRASVRGAA